MGNVILVSDVSGSMFTENGKPPKTSFGRNFASTLPPDLVEPPFYCKFDYLPDYHLLKK